MPPEAPPQVCLASASPRRLELLRQLGLRCEVAAADVDEMAGASEAAPDLACRLALAKARRGAELRSAPSLPVIGADTVVALGEEILGKPADEADALRILTRLSGRTHRVCTAVALTDGTRERVQVSCSEVSFRNVSPAEIRAYWRTGEPADKAGAYAIQGLGAIFVSHLSGSYSGVMGLPLFETARLLGSFGFSLLGAQRDG